MMPVLTAIPSLSRIIPTSEAIPIPSKLKETTLVLFAFSP